MVKYLGKRILIGILSLFVLSAVTFFLTRAIPGSPFQSQNISGDVLEMMEEEYGLNRPVFIQYKAYLGNLLHGDLGYSYQNPGESVTEIIARSLPATITIGSLSIVVAMIAGMGFGIWQGISSHRSVKGVIFTGTMLGAGIPNFVTALVLMLIFGVWFKLLPVAGLTSWRHYILPVFSLALYPTSVVARLTRNLLEEESKKEYVVLAKAKGLKKYQIVYTHILKHIWIPVLNYLGPASAFLLTGSFVVESIFTIPGLGRQFVNSISNRDYTLIMGLTFFMGMMVILINLAVDILCAWIDPRVRKAYLEK